ncbi:MAG: CidA/LrgA family protein [Campylobacter sp.]|nr:CidA/LrgA family protein [Campylobacter sp.]
MKYLEQISIIFGISFIAELMAYFIPINMPGSIYGLVLMFLGLYFRVIKVSQVRNVSSFFIEIMPIIFIPAGVGLMDNYAPLLKNIIPISVIVLVSTVAIMVVSAHIVQQIYKYSVIKAKKRLHDKFAKKGQK